MSNDIRLEDIVIHRGQLLVDGGPAGSRIRIIFDDGLPNYTQRIEDFKIIGQNGDGLSSHRFAAVLHTGLPLKSGLSFDYSDPKQIAWSTVGLEDTYENESRISDIDPTNCIVRELFLTAWSDTSGDVPLNYMITARRLILNDEESVVALANDVSTLT
jgi:hypothetical protein